MLNVGPTALFKAVSKHIRLSPSRHETLGWLVTAMLSAGTTSLWKLAPHVGSAAEVESVYRRLARFFQYVRFDGGAFARLIVVVLDLGKIGAWDLALDRTNWKLGKVHINILMLGVVWNGICVPLFWMLLPKAGNSNTDERIKLLKKLQRTFPNQRLGSLMGDREFIGGAWMEWLTTTGISFVLRLREDMHVFNAAHAPLPLSHVARNLRVGQKMILKGSWHLGHNEVDASPLVRIIILRLESGELLSLATDKKPKTALARYRTRWKIETLFAALKTRGFNLEATHITDPKKLALLVGVLALAAALAYKTGLWATKLKPTAIKKHGRLAKSIFRRGLETLKKLLAGPHTGQSKNIFAWLFSPQAKPNSLILNGS
jgi:Transposase DDE domain